MADDTTDTQATTPDAATSQADTTSPITGTDDTAGTEGVTAPAAAEPVVSSEDATDAPAPLGEGEAGQAPAPVVESAPSGGDGSQGTELPAAPEADKAEDTSEVDQALDAPAAEQPSPAASEGLQEASATAEAPPEGDALTPPSEPEAEGKSEGAETSPIAATDGTPGASSGAPEAAPLSAPEDTPATEEGGVGTEQADAVPAPEEGTGEAAEAQAPAEEDGAAQEAPAATDAQTQAPATADVDTRTPDEVKSDDKPADEPAPTPVVLTSPMLSDGSIPQHGTNDAPSNDPLQPTTLFGGQAGPSPAPDVDPATILPHPALTENSPGFISGTTQGTQSALPVPGPADAAASTAASLSKAGNTAAGDLPDSTVNTGGLDATGTDDAAEAGDKASSGASEATSALPVAGIVQDTFKTLSDDGKAIVEALSKVSDGIGDVIALEFKSLANLAAHISGRLDETKRKLTEPEQRMQLIQVGNQVMELLQSLQSLFGESADDAPLPPDVEEVIANLGDLGESARDALYSED